MTHSEKSGCVFFKRFLLLYGNSAIIVLVKQYNNIALQMNEGKGKMGELIKIEDVYKIYNPGENEVHALDGISLTIEEGEFVAIIGHSGSGKSTFMNMLGCLDVPTSGKYYLQGKDVSALNDNQLSDIRNRQIGFIFQGFNLFLI